MSRSKRKRAIGNTAYRLVQVAQTGDISWPNLLLPKFAFRRWFPAQQAPDRSSLFDAQTCRNAEAGSEGNASAVN
jgi:hypothetical protein